MISQCLRPIPSTDFIEASRIQLNAYVKRIGVAYWQKLVQVGVPTGDARSIAAAIAKYDAASRLPNSEQKQLIAKYSPLICRAHLWRTDMLLLAS